jgi:hypothetical protein
VRDQLGLGVRVDGLGVSVLDELVVLEVGEAELRNAAVGIEDPSSSSL